MADRRSLQDAALLSHDVDTYACLPQEVGGDASIVDNLEESARVQAMVENEEQKLPFIDTLRARTFVGTVIVLDLFCLGAEADCPGSHWAVVEVLLVVFYIVEMVIRIRSQGFQMFVPSDIFLGKNYKTKSSTAALNYFRMLLVILGIIDSFVWVFNIESWRVLFMYLRLLRVVRIFNLFDVLTRFIVALLIMTQSLSWIFCVIALVSYVSAVFFTLYAKEHELEDAQEFFPDVWSGAFSLFQVTTMDNWHDIAVPLVRYNGAWGLFFVFFIAFTSWTMISLLTAVVSEQIILATRDMKVRETEMVEQRHKDFVFFLKRCFTHADSDGNGVLDKAEFTSLIQEEIVTRKMEDLGVIIQHEELQDTFDMLDVDESGELTIDEFTVGLSQLQQSLGIKHVLSINYAIQRTHRRLQKQMQSDAEASDSRFREVMAKLDGLCGSTLSRGDIDTRIERLDRKMGSISETIKAAKPRASQASSITRFFDKGAEMPAPAPPPPAR